MLFLIKRIVIGHFAKNGIADEEIKENKCAWEDTISNLFYKSPAVKSFTPLTGVNIGGY